MSKQLFAIRQQANNPNTLDLYIYDDVEGDRRDWWSGELIESETSAKFIKKTLEENSSATLINVYINSYGGEVKEGLAIYNQLKRHSAQVNVYIDGFACSIASVIAMAGDNVIMGDNALMMIHHASMGVWGNAEEIRKAANDLEVIDSASCSSYLTKAGDKLDEDTLKELLDAQTWLNAKQCLEYGLIDQIAGEKESVVKKAKQSYEKSIELRLKQLNDEHNLFQGLKDSKPGTIIIEKVEKEHVDNPTQYSKEKDEPKEVSNFYLLQKMFKKEGM